MAKIRLVFFILAAFIFLTTLVQNCNGQKTKWTKGQNGQNGQNKSKKSGEVPQVLKSKKYKIRTL